MKDLLIIAVIALALACAYKIGMYNNYDYEARYVKTTSK